MRKALARGASSGIMRHASFHMALMALMVFVVYGATVPGTRSPTASIAAVGARVNRAAFPIEQPIN